MSRATSTRRAALPARMAALSGVLAALVLGTAAPASAGQDAVDVHVQCVWHNDDGSLTSVWSYVNHTDAPVDIPVGDDNRVTTAPEDRGQPTHFLPGEHLSAWIVSFSDSSLAWHVLTNGDTANNGSKACANNPVAVVGDWRAAMLGAGLLLPVTWWFVRRSRFRSVIATGLPWRCVR